MLRYLLLTLLLATSASAQNLLTNGDFEKPFAANTDPAGWHARITGVITISEYKDPDHKKGLLYKHFRDGCGYDWGRVRPWPGLVCPQCHQMITTEESSDWYTKNYLSVFPGPGSNGRGILMKMDASTGENQGVRLCSNFIKAEKNVGYVFGVDAMVKGGGVGAQIFVECFKVDDEDQEAKDWVKTLPPEVNPLKMTGRLKRTFRGHIYPNVGGNWAHLSDSFVMPKNPLHQFDVMYMTLYGYGAAGEAGFDNAFIRKMNAKELEAYWRDPANTPKDERFR